MYEQPEPTEAAWNRSDNRECPTSATKWSIYCALEKATLDVTGGPHHRRPALRQHEQSRDEHMGIAGTSFVSTIGFACSS
jgi:hypothetical protein